jgi:hypothetical protein
MKGISRSRILTLVVYLAAVALLSGAVAYGQYCYGSSQWLYAWSGNDFYDGECATYGPWVVCQRIGAPSQDVGAVSPDAA